MIDGIPLTDNCCGQCKHFLTDGTTVGEVDPSYGDSDNPNRISYADVCVGECEFSDMAFDPSHHYEGADHYRWETHVPCKRFDRR